jgi:hypothetical protein
MRPLELSTYLASIVYAHWPGEEAYSPIASLMDCPARGIAIRWYHIPAGTSGANEIAPSMDAAKKLVEDWVRGMEIEPW